MINLAQPSHYLWPKTLEFRHEPKTQSGVDVTNPRANPVNKLGR